MQSRESRWVFNQRKLIGNLTGHDDSGPMLQRWILVRTPWFGIYVHFIYREDLDRDPHDHPWVFRTWILRGGYTEEYQVDPRVRLTSDRTRRERWSYRRFPLQAAHRITSVDPKTTTLVLVGPKVREWGFYVEPGLWIEQTAYGATPPQVVR